MTVFDRIRAAGKALTTPQSYPLVKGTKAIEAVWRPSTTGFGPGEPLFPAAPKESPRRNDYQVSRNTIWTPRAEENRAVTYDQMRSLSRLHGVLRTVIEKRKDEIKGLEWEITVKPEYNSEDYADQIKTTLNFWKKPDLETPFDQWLNAILEDLYVCDAPALYKERDRIGRFRALQIIDGATFKVLVNDAGRIPSPPNLAYEQIIKGQPRTGYIKPLKGINPYMFDFDKPRIYLDGDVETHTNFEELYYRPYNIASDGVYGYSHVESIIMTINVSLRRDVSFLEWFRSGNIPAALASVPETWNPDQITQFQQMFDTYLSGDTAARAGLHFVPAGINSISMINSLTFDSVFDQWLARIICARFGESPIPYVSVINRATAETMEESSRDTGLVPVTQYLKEWFDDVIENDLGFPMLQFKWNPGQNYGKDDALMDDTMLKNGSMTLDQLREKQGKTPYENGIGSKPMIWAGGLPVLLEDIISGKAQEQNTQGMAQDALQGQSDGLNEQPQLSPDNPFTLSLKSMKDELNDWEKFAINRIGKKTRNFETKSITNSDAIQKELANANTPAEIKAVFDTARHNLGRAKRTPSVDKDLAELEAEYKKILVDTMNKAKEAV